MQLRLCFKRRIASLILILTPVLICSQSAHIDSLINLLHITNKTEGKIKLFEHLTFAYSDTSRMKAIYYCNEAIKLSEKNENTKLLGDLYLRVGRLWEQEDLYLKAIDYYNQAMEIARNNNDKHQLAFCYYRIGNTERKLCNYQSALTNCFYGQTLYEEINDLDGLGKIFNCYGSIYRVMNDHDKAILNYSKCIEISAGLKNNRAIGIAYNNIAIVYYDIGDNRLAESFYYKSLNIDESSLQFKANTLSNLAKLYIAKGELTKFKKFHNEALRIRLKIGDKSGLVSSYYICGKYYSTVDSTELAKQYLFIALEKALEINMKTRIKDIYDLLYQIYDEEGNTEKTFEYYKKYKLIYDEIYNIEKSKYIAYYEQLYKNAKLKDKERIYNLKKNFILIGVFLIIIGVFAFRFIRHKSRLEKERLEKKVLSLQKKHIEINLDVKNKEISALVLNQAMVNGIIEKAKQELAIKKYDLKKENQKPIQLIIDELNRNLKPGIWQEFELRFIEVHKEFYVKLLDKFPNLSQNEKRLCALLRLNMSTKEISTLTNQSIHSIEIARSRLRKKLHIVNKNISIVNFLSNL